MQTPIHTLAHTLTNIFSTAFQALDLPSDLGEVKPADRPDLAQFQCNGALAAAKQAGKNPREIASAVVEHVQTASPDLFAKLDIAGPGFINITLTDTFLRDTTAAIAHDGVPQVEASRRVFIDYGGSNAAKPLHVGHLRAAIIGEAIKRLYRAMGDTVVGDIHWGDWGTHIGMVITEIERRGLDINDVDAAMLAEIYPAASKRCKENEADMAEASRATFDLQQGTNPTYRQWWEHLMKLSRQVQENTYNRLGVHFDQWFGESRYQDRIPAMIDRLRTSGVVEDSRGAQIIRVVRDDDKAEFPPLLLTKTDGGYLYATTDLATVEERVDEFAAQLILYVVDNRQALHFEQVFRAARLGGVLPEEVGVDFLGFGTVNGADGKPFKTRDGRTPQLDELIDLATDAARQRLTEAGLGQDLPQAEQDKIAEAVALAAIKFGDLSNDFHHNYVFDVDKFSRFEGKTGPYLQYAGVRIRSLLDKAVEAGLKAGDLQPATTEEERALMLHMAQLPEAYHQAYARRAPHILCDYAYGLAQAFSRFYNACHILTAEDKAQQASWLTLSERVLAQLTATLDILGIDIPERM